MIIEIKTAWELSGKYEGGEEDGEHPGGVRHLEDRQGAALGKFRWDCNGGFIGIQYFRFLGAKEPDIWGSWGSGT